MKKEKMLQTQFYSYFWLNVLHSFKISEKSNFRILFTLISILFANWKLMCFLWDLSAIRAESQFDNLAIFELRWRILANSGQSKSGDTRVKRNEPSERFNKEFKRLCFHNFIHFCVLWSKSCINGIDFANHPSTRCYWEAFILSRQPRWI